MIFLLSLSLESHMAVQSENPIIENFGTLPMDTQLLFSPKQMEKLQLKTQQTQVREPDTSPSQEMRNRALLMNSLLLASQQGRHQNLMAVKLFSRNKRTAQINGESMEEFLTQLEIKRRKLGLIEETKMVPTEGLDEDKMREIVTIMIQDEIRRKQMDTDKLRTNTEFGVSPETLATETPPLDIMGGSLALGGRLIPELGMESLTEAIMEEIKRRTNNQTSASALGEALTPSEGLPTPGVIIGLPIETQSPSHSPPPQVSVEELPSDSPGCRTLATKTCYKTPVIINKKVRSLSPSSCHRVSWELSENIITIWLDIFSQDCPEFATQIIIVDNNNYQNSIDKKNLCIIKPSELCRNRQCNRLIFVNDNDCCSESGTRAKRYSEYSFKL